MGPYYFLVRVHHIRELMTTQMFYAVYSHARTNCVSAIE